MEKAKETISLKELVRLCYKHVAPAEIDQHYERLNKIAAPRSILPTPTVLGCRAGGIAFADIFCGAGGLSLGFELEGASCKLALDHDSSAIETYSINRPKNAVVICSEIETFLNSTTPILDVPLLIGGPPCQGFSLANQQPKAADPRNRLYCKFLETAELARSNVLVIENVPGILKHWELISGDLKKHGYFSQVFEMQASDYGVPQKRKRVFIIAAKGLGGGKENLFLAKIKSILDMQRGTYAQTILSDALTGLPIVEAKTIRNSTNIENKEFGYSIGPPSNSKGAYLERINEGFPNGFLFNHRTKYNNPRDINLFKALREGEDTTSEAFALINPYRNREHIFKDKFYRLRASRPSKTITAHMYYDCHMYIHPNQDRGLTPREAARIQGFPDQYIFLGKPNEWYRQIGNSVSPLISRCVAKGVLKAMELDY